MASIVVRIKLVLQNGAVHAGDVPQLVPFPQDVLIRQYDDAEIHFDFVGQDYAPVPIPEGAAFQAVARREYYSADPPPLSVEATITNPDGGGDCGFFPIDSSITGAMVVADFPWSVVYIDPAGKRWTVMPQAVFTVGPTEATPGTPVIPGESQPPLGLGPAGITWRGAWSSVVAYALRDGVSYPDSSGGGNKLSSFRALQASTNQPPVDISGNLNAAYWAYIAQCGADGNGAEGGARSFRFDVTEGDGNDLIVTIPVAARQTGDYGVSISCRSLVAWGPVVFPLGDQTSDQFRCVLSAAVDATLEFTITPVIT